MRVGPLGGNYGQGLKVCPKCRQQTDLKAERRDGCGHVFRQNFAPPQGAQQPDPTQAFFGSGQAPAYGGQLDLMELARRFNDCRRLFLWTFWLGMFCLWPIWIVTYIEHTKMREIKDLIGSCGINVYWWQQAYNARYAF